MCTCTSPFPYGHSKYLSLPKDPKATFSQHPGFMQLWSREGNSARESVQPS